MNYVVFVADIGVDVDKDSYMYHQRTPLATQTKNIVHNAFHVSDNSVVVFCDYKDNLATSTSMSTSS